MLMTYLLFPANKNTLTGCLKNLVNTFYSNTLEHSHLAKLYGTWDDNFLTEETTYLYDHYQTTSTQY